MLDEAIGPYRSFIKIFEYCLDLSKADIQEGYPSKVGNVNKSKLIKRFLSFASDMIKAPRKTELQKRL